jgi:ATP-dependent Clp protease ATP-binding subunit ClpB
MSEYMEKHSVSRLIWSPPGYIGHDEWGQLTEAVRRKPYSVILFDEVEKAHSDVFNILLQVLDDWRLTDSKWRVVNFSNTIIILTSNIWSHKIQDLTKQEKSSAEIYNELESDLRLQFRPEFINRLDDIILFNPLSEDLILSIVDILLRPLINILKNKGIKANISMEVKKYLAKIWYDRDFWARPLKRAINTKLVNELSNEIISWELKYWDDINIDINNDFEIIITKKTS